MGLQSAPTIVVVTRQTRLEGLKHRWGTARQAKFLLAQAHVHEAEQRQTSRSKSRGAAAGRPSPVAAEADFDVYEREDVAYRQTIDRLERDLEFGLPVKFLDRGYVPTYDFWNAVAVVVVGQDGLVANTAKYVADRPIVAINPDPARIDGVLLPFSAGQARQIVGRVLEGKFRHRPVTLAEVNLNDGQRMLAFNDFYIGASSHISARYTLEAGGRSEPQSSSGVLVSTGAGSTGWLSSVFNMTAGVAELTGTTVEGRVQLEWEDRRLVWAVREPFASKTSRANLVAGLLDEGQQLVIESLMPASGVIFSDGIETDYFEFTSGTIARIAASKQAAHLVVS